MSNIEPEVRVEVLDWVPTNVKGDIVTGVRAAA
jgi:hypothetical protein